MKKIFLSFLILGTFATPLFLTAPAMAQNPPPAAAAAPATAVPSAGPDAAVTAALQQAQISNPLDTSDVRVLIGRVIKTLLGLSGGLALVMFIWGGLVWMTSQGDKNRVEKGQKTLTWAVLGLVVLFTSYAIVNLVIGTLSRAT